MGEIIMSHDQSNSHWIYNRTTKRWKEKTMYNLKDIEIQVLKYSMMGYTMNEISDLIHRSFDTVKVYRKTILEKLNADNITEAINIAITYRLI